MSKTERVTLTGAHEHVSEIEGREHSHVFAAGTHSLPPEVAASARAAGLVAETPAAPAQPRAKAKAAPKKLAAPAKSRTKSQAPPVYIAAPATRRAKAKT